CLRSAQDVVSSDARPSPRLPQDADRVPASVLDRGSLRGVSRSVSLACRLWCPRCGHDVAWALSARRLRECAAGVYQASTTAGTILHRTRTPLMVWFWAG